MTFQTVTLQVPAPVYHRAQRTARALERPLEEILVETLSVALPPLDDVPSDILGELAALSTLPDETLWEVARSVMPSKMQARLRTLSNAQRKRALKPSEIRELEQLRREYGRVTLRKAQAYALLRQRGLYSLAAI